MVSAAQGIALGALGVLLWQLLRHLFVRTALDNIPGPRPASFWNGECLYAVSLEAAEPLTTLFLGNLSQIFDRHGWNFHRELGEKYGSVVALNGFFGVRLLGLWYHRRTNVTDDCRKRFFTSMTPKLCITSA